jgi:CheY-like chemotaxis protein
LVAQAADAVRPAAAAKSIALTIADGPACFVRGDAGRLQQVVWNLLSNAVKFTPARGTIQVGVAPLDTHVSIAIADSGVGIAPQFLPYVFDRFRQADQSSTRAHGGLGLGLAIVKHLTELHGGTVTASSDGLARGATFRVLLPAEQHVLPKPLAASAAVAEVSLPGRSILVVDDDASTREVVAAVLERAGADVAVAASAAEAWSVLQRQRPDLVIADLAMPNEDGFSFISRVRQMPATGVSLPAIALSAYADPRSEEAARAAGFSAFLAKPARPDALLQLVSDLLAAAASQSA